MTISFTVVESILALVDREQADRSPYYGDYGDILNFDPNHEGGHLRPNLDGWMKGTTLDHPVPIITNSRGFRNSREFDYIPVSRTYRILLLGDSYVDGMRTDQLRTIGYLFEQSEGSDTISNIRIL